MMIEQLCVHCCACHSTKRHLMNNTHSMIAHRHPSISFASVTLRPFGHLRTPSDTFSPPGTPVARSVALQLNVREAEVSDTDRHLPYVVPHVGHVVVACQGECPLEAVEGEVVSGVLWMYRGVMQKRRHNQDEKQ